MGRHEKDPKRIAEVVLGLPLEGPFSYFVPKKFRVSIQTGHCVRVPFGRFGQRTGYVVGFKQDSALKKLKNITQLLGAEPVLDQGMLELTRWMADYYHCSWGQAIEAAVPAPLRKGAAHTPHAGEEEEAFAPSFHLDLNTEQKEALEKIRKKIEEYAHQTFLLYGITGSGKTEVYLQAIQEVMDRRRSTIMLVPEISLTPQALERFKSRFGDHVAILHSRLTSSTRYREWQRIKSGQARIVIGARSAVFAPVENLGLVIVDEEHETSYKQEEVPRYHGRDVAIKRALLQKAVVILGSATPSLESYYQASRGAYAMIALTKRTEDRLLPEVEVVDMRQELREARRRSVFSRRLENEIRANLGKNGQAILFLNRRGFSTFMNCRKCGHVLKCRRCDATLTYHFSTQSLVCHYCNKTNPAPDICPECRSGYITYHGAGTEKVEAEARRLFPAAAIARMDSDSTKKRTSYKHILSDFKDGKIDILIGTQMVAKGFDFPQVHLVGVVMADATLSLPDFRSTERAFNLVTQAAGRAGRGPERGKVIIQTYSPTQYAIECAKKHDYTCFYEKEIEARRELGLPPFKHIVRLTLRSRSQASAGETAEGLAASLRKNRPRSINVSIPAPAVIFRMRGQYRFNIIAKSASQENMSAFVKERLSGFNIRRGVFLAVDVDPISI